MSDEMSEIGKALEEAADGIVENDKEKSTPVENGAEAGTEESAIGEAAETTAEAAGTTDGEATADKTTETTEDEVTDEAGKSAESSGGAEAAADEASAATEETMEAAAEETTEAADAESADETGEAVENVSEAEMETATDEVAEAAADEAEKPAAGGKKKWILLAAACVALAAGAIAFAVYENSLVYKSCSVEAGVEVTAADFLTGGGYNREAYIVGYEDGFDTSVPGEYELKVKIGLFSHTVTLSVQDTIAPELELSDAVIGYGEEISADAFAAFVSDATEVTLSFLNEPDTAVCGEQTVEIRAVDMGGNETVQEATLTVWPLKQTLEAEAGEALPDVADFLLDESISDASFVTDTSEIEMNHVGSHDLTVEVDGEQYDVQLVVVDTQSPELAVQDVDGYLIVGYDAAAFVAECGDATDVTFSYGEEPDFNREGEQTVTIIATDEGGNTASADAVLTLQEDTEAPVITGAIDRTVYIGDTVSYRSFLSASDNCEEGLTFTIDSGDVNLNTEGTYTVTCTATDAAGNTTTAEFSLTVAERTYSENEAFELADAVLAEILTDDMSNYDKAYAIFCYIKSHVSYVSTSDHSTWTKAASDALTTGRGDCYSYASVSKLLLTRAGITNMDIHKIPTSTRHYWNLVDIGDGHGWYHFDTTPRRNGHPQIFLWTDAQMMEYSEANNDCFNYDRSAYPEIP